MKLGIMQPYLFPYIGYWQLMDYVDEWVVFDDTQFIDKGWINRNRVLHPEAMKEWQYFTVPLRDRGQFDRISSITIDSHKSWKKTLIGKLGFYKKLGSNYHETIDFVDYCLDEDETNLSVLVIDAMRKVADKLKIETKIQVQSKLNLDVGDIEHSGQWALRISSLLGASEYVNPVSGRALFHKEEFDKDCIDIRFIQGDIVEYFQGGRSFVPGLSIIDVLMFCSAGEIRQMLNRHCLV